MRAIITHIFLVEKNAKIGLISVKYTDDAVYAHTTPYCFLFGLTVVSNYFVTTGNRLLLRLLHHYTANDRTKCSSFTRCT